MTRRRRTRQRSHPPPPPPPPPHPPPPPPIPFGGRPGVAAWLELVRAGNLPTTLSNALVGWAISTTAAPDRRFALAAIAIASLYAAGMIFNDICDEAIDRRERPRRPIPSGRIPLPKALAAFVLLAALALLLLGLASPAAIAAGGVLVALIVLYDLWHARSVLSVLVMAACRAMIYVVVGCAAQVPGGWPLPATTTTVLAVCLASYVTALSLVARLEMTNTGGARGWRRAAPLLLPILPLLAVVAVRPGGSAAGTGVAGLAPLVQWWPALVAAAAMGAWIARGVQHALAQPPRRGPAVSVWIAGIALVDAFFLTLLDRPGLALAALACWAATVVAQRRLSAT